MFIAKSIREKSVVEYLLYMWQMEDLIRAYGCSLTRIRREYIDRFEYTDQQKDEEEDWFGDLIRMMNQEGKREKGHLAINEVLLQDLGDLHVRLLQSTRFPFYSAEYYRVLPFIVELRQKGDKEIGGRDLPQRPLWCNALADAAKAYLARDRSRNQSYHDIPRHAL